MPVIINDFEVSVEPPRSEGGSASASQPTSGQAQVRPDAIENIERYIRERRRRVKAD